MISYQKADKNLYHNFKHDLENLYLKTFTTGISAQKITHKEAENFLDSLFKVGYGVFGFSEGQLISALLVTPASYDKDRPDNIKKLYKDDDSLYIAEVLVDENYRGQGLGKKLMQEFEQHLDEHINHVLLRVWKENTPAVALYEKMGFEICGEITQVKTRPDTKEKFTMHKNYMIKSY
jgi:ribosomal protein S18 acetylase RimI-like enzyme